MSIWAPKPITVEEANDLTKLIIDSLIGKLKVHEVQLKGKEKEKEKDKESSSKRKTIAFKGYQDSSDGNNIDINQEVANLSRRMSKFVRKNKNFRRKLSNKFSYNLRK